MEYLVEAKGETVKGRLISPRTYPTVIAKQCYIIDGCAKVKRQILSNYELALYAAIIPPERQFLHDRARDCQELADTPSA